MSRVVVVVLAGLLSLAACDGGGPEPKEPDQPMESASSSGSSGPPVSPEPTNVPELDAQQQQAFDQALDRYREYLRFVDQVGAKPAVSDEVAREAADYLVMPATKVFSDSVDQLLADGIRISGSRKIEWAVPVSASRTKVILRQCESPGTWRAIQDGKANPQRNNIVTRAEMVWVEDKWRLRNQGGDGEC